MSKINILALGGLDEKEKGMYIVDVDSKIYIFDAGVYEPLNNEFGVQHFIPRLDYLEENRDKIKGIFLSSANILKIGALSQIIKIVPNIKIFGSKITMDSLPIFFGSKAKDWNTFVLNPGEVTKDLQNEIKAIPVSGSIPGSYGYSVATPDGNIIYMTDYIFDSIEEYQVNIMDELEALSHEKNLVFMSDSLNANILSSISPHFRITSKIKEPLKGKKRMVVAIYEDEIINIIEIINRANKDHKKIFFTDRKMLNLIIMMMNNKQIPVHNVKLFEKNYDDANKEKSIIIVTGTRTNLYQKILIYIEEVDPLKFKIEHDDIFVMAAPPQAGNEHVYATITNNIFKIDPEIITWSANEKLSIHPSQFDIKNYLKFINPEYLMPIQGYYMQMVKVKELAHNLGMVSSKKVIMADNGEIMEIEDGVYNGLVRKIRETGNTIIEEVTDARVATEVIENRAALAKDGLCTIGLMYDKKTCKVISNIDIQMRGVIFVNNQEQLMSKIEDSILTTLKQNQDNFKQNKVESLIKKDLTKIFRTQIKKIPMIVLKLEPMEIK